MIGELFPSVILELKDIEDLNWLKNLAAPDSSPLHSPDDDNLLAEEIKIKVDSTKLTQYIDFIIIIAKKCHAKRLWFTFTAPQPIIPPRMDPDSVNQLIASLPCLTELQSLRITKARLNTNQAIKIIHALPPCVKELDLDHNIIGNHDGQNFTGFCEAIVNSNLQAFIFGTTNFNDEEANILAKLLATIQRPFEFIFHVGPHITPIIFQYYMNAMHQNPFLSISLSGKLQYASQYDTKGPPSLFQLALSKCLSSFPKELLNTPPEVTKAILEIQPQLNTYHKNFDMKRMLQHYTQALLYQEALEGNQTECVSAEASERRHKKV